MGRPSNYKPTAEDKAVNAKVKQLGDYLDAQLTYWCDNNHRYDLASSAMEAYAALISALNQWRRKAGGPPPLELPFE